MHRVNQRMANKLRRHARFLKKFLFKRKNAESLHEAPPHQVYAPRTPGPKLRTNVVNILDAEGEQFTSQPQMKAGEVCQYCEPWFFLPCCAGKPSHGPDQRGQMADNFSYSYDGYFGI